MLAAAYDKQVGKNDQITFKGNEELLKKNDYEEEDNLNGMNIVIQDSNSKKPTEKSTKVVNYETFESSSEDEFSCGAFESAAASYTNKEKTPEDDLNAA